MANSVIAAQPVPLTRDDTGAWRVTGTRIPLERIIEAHQSGAAAETIVQWFDDLRLADVYAVLSYYLNHPDEVETYLRERAAEAVEVRRRIEAGQPARPGFRAKIRSHASDARLILPSPT